MKNSTIAGFLDGYQSRNIASFENNFHFKLNDVRETTSRLLVDLKSQPAADPELIHALEKNATLFADRSANFAIDQLYAIGEFLKLNLKALNELSNLPDPAVYSKVKMLVFNFLELAKISENPKLINLAIEIGARFRY